MNLPFKGKLNGSTIFVFPAIVFVLFFCSCSNLKSGENEPAAYLFSYFTGNGPGEEAIRFAISTDGYNYRALNNNEPVLDSKISANRAVCATRIFCAAPMVKHFTWLPLIYMFLKWGGIIML